MVVRGAQKSESHSKAFEAVNALVFMVLFCVVVVVGSNLGAKVIGFSANLYHDFNIGYNKIDELFNKFDQHPFIPCGPVVAYD
jgi:hypothetical protein